MVVRELCMLLSGGATECLFGGQPRRQIIRNLHTRKFLIPGPDFGTPNAPQKGPIDTFWDPLTPQKGPRGCQGGDRRAQISMYLELWAGVLKRGGLPFGGQGVKKSKIQNMRFCILLLGRLFVSFLGRRGAPWGGFEVPRGPK